MPDRRRGQRPEAAGTAQLRAPPGSHPLRRHRKRRGRPHGGAAAKDRRLVLESRLQVRRQLHGHPRHRHHPAPRFPFGGPAGKPRLPEPEIPSRSVRRHLPLMDGLGAPCLGPHRPRPGKNRPRLLFQAPQGNAGRLQSPLAGEAQLLRSAAHAADGGGRRLQLGNAEPAHRPRRLFVLRPVVPVLQPRRGGLPRRRLPVLRLLRPLSGPHRLQRLFRHRHPGDGPEHGPCLRLGRGHPAPPPGQDHRRHSGKGAPAPPGDRPGLRHLRCGDQPVPVVLKGAACPGIRPSGPVSAHSGRPLHGG